MIGSWVSMASRETECAGAERIVGPLSENHDPRQVAETQQARVARLLAHELKQASSALCLIS
jgi:hypothetical protein